MIGWLSQNAGLSGLLFFFFVFCGIALWAYQPKMKAQLEQHKNIPLRGDDA